MIIDILVALMVLGAALVGFRRGFIQPLLGELLFVGTLLFLLNNRDAYMTFVGGVFHANAFIAVFAALIVAALIGYVGLRAGGILHRMPSVRGWDGFLGVFVQALAAIVLAYGLLSAMVVMDKAVAITVNSTSLTVAQVRSLQKELASNSLTAPLVDNQGFKTLLGGASRPGGARLSDAGLLDQVQTFYTDVFRPQLQSSRLAPWVMRIGEHVPVIGHFGPKDLPRR
jgi:hypothetical protein